MRCQRNGTKLNTNKTKCEKQLEKCKLDYELAKKISTFGWKLNQDGENFTESINFTVSCDCFVN